MKLGFLPPLLSATALGLLAGLLASPSVAAADPGYAGGGAPGPARATR
jgi:hypothetical protein